MNHALHLALLGAAAGAAGTTALNALTYMDMATRGRPSSSTPETTVERLSQVAHVPIPGDEEARKNRVAGLGPLTGQLAGVGIGALLGLARAPGWRPAIGVSTAVATVGAMVGTSGPMPLLGVTDPRAGAPRGGGGGPGPPRPARGRAAGGRAGRGPPGGGGGGPGAG
ncbi:MAG: hypothetical protein LH469_13160, partial [Frankiaceae bacterium]|nr:hypothetical protein [Frankiaceae bacterium]